MKRPTVLLSLVIFGLVPAASAEIVFDGSPGTGPPPATLGGYEMIPFPLDERPLFEDVMTLPSPFGGEVGLSIPMSHRRIGSGWSIVGHGYEGDVYFDNYASSVVLTMPPGTVAFYFYVSANGSVTFDVTADDGTSSGEMYDYWALPCPFVGFYATDGDTIETLTLNGSREFAIADFGIAVPEPATVVILALAGLAALRRRGRNTYRQT